MPAKFVDFAMRLEAEVVADVALAVAVVVDVDLVANARIEREEVRPTGRLFERHVVGDDREAVRIVRTDERVEVRVVRGGIARDERRLPVAGREDTRDGCRRDEQGADDSGDLGSCRQDCLPW